MTNPSRGTFWNLIFIFQETGPPGFAYKKSRGGLLAGGTSFQLPSSELEGNALGSTIMPCPLPSLNLAPPSTPEDRGQHMSSKPKGKEVFLASTSLLRLGRSLHCTNEEREAPKRFKVSQGSASFLQDLQHWDTTQPSPSFPQLTRLVRTQNRSPYPTKPHLQIVISPGFGLGLWTQEPLAWPGPWVSIPALADHHGMPGTSLD